MFPFRTGGNDHHGYGRNMAYARVNVAATAPPRHPNRGGAREHGNGRRGRGRGRGRGQGRNRGAPPSKEYDPFDFSFSPVAVARPPVCPAPVPTPTTKEYDPFSSSSSSSSPSPPALLTLWGEHVERRLLPRMFEETVVPQGGREPQVPLSRVLPLVGCEFFETRRPASSLSTAAGPVPHALSRNFVDWEAWRALDETLFAARDYGATRASIGNEVDQRTGRPQPAAGWGMLKPRLRELVETWAGARLHVCPLFKYRSLEESRRAVYLTLQYMFFHVRNGIYVQVRGGEVRVFEPFHNLEPEYRNTWPAACLPPAAEEVKRDGVEAIAAGSPTSVSNRAQPGRPAAGLDLRALLQEAENGGGQAAVEAYYRDKRAEWGERMCRGDEDVLLDVRQWWANAYVVDNVPQVRRHGGWSAAKNQELEEMLRATCASVFVPDCDFFLNKRDFPHLHYDVRAQQLSEPYPFLYGSMDGAQHFPLSPPRGLDYDERSRLAPIFSFAGGPEFADLLMPTPEDWRLATGADEDIASARLGCAECFSFAAKPRGEAVWRGSATGPGVTCDDNQRLALVHLARHGDKETRRRLDCKLTGINLRDRMCADGRVHFISLETAREVTGCATAEEIADLRVRNHLSFVQQCAYKYVLYVQGHSAAYRYGKLMFSHSVILRVRSTVAAPDLWFFPCLRGARVAAALPRPDEAERIAQADHLEVRADLADLPDVLDWCDDHPEECAQIARNAYSLAEQLFTKDTIAQYWHALLTRTHLNQRHFLTEYKEDTGPAAGLGPAGL